MHHIESPLHKNVRANDETRRGEVAILHNVTQERLQFLNSEFTRLTFAEESS